MRLLILGDPVGNTAEDNRKAYRGTYRDRPSYADSFPDTHPVNIAFFWSIQKDPAREEDHDLDLVYDLDKARDLVQVYHRDVGQEFEIIEVTKDEEPPEVGAEFIGYDLSRGLFNSLLWYGLEVCYRSTGAWDDQREDILRLIQPLVCLVEEHFKPRLNSAGLFDEYADAKACLDCMTSIQTICPDWFESGENTFEVVGLYRVPVTAGKAAGKSAAKP